MRAKKLPSFLFFLLLGEKMLSSISLAPNSRCFFSCLPPLERLILLTWISHIFLFSTSIKWRREGVRKESIQDYASSLPRRLGRRRSTTSAASSSFFSDSSLLPLLLLFATFVSPKRSFFPYSLLSLRKALRCLRGKKEPFCYCRYVERHKKGDERPEDRIDTTRILTPSRLKARQTPDAE